MQNRRIIENGTHIVHEGLQNSTDVRKFLSEISKKIIDISNNNHSHLTDIALDIDSQAKKLSQISKDLLIRHEYEKVNGVIKHK